MSPPSVWGPSTWVFFHTLAEKLKDESFAVIGKNLIHVIIQICENLPCPTCSSHAKQFWAKVSVGNIKSKTDLINLLFMFHNIVNKRKNVPLFKYEDLQYYKTRNVVETYNAFTRNFSTRGNMKLLNESFHRNIMLAKLKKWLMRNIIHFTV